MNLAMQLSRLPREAVVNWQQAKDFFTTTTSDLQAATADFKNTSSEAMLNAIASSFYNWLQAHPVLFRIFTAIIWTLDRPVIGFTVIILTLAIAFSLVKALNRLLEMLGLSILQAPFKLVKNVFKLGKLGITRKNISDITCNDPSTISQNPQQRLAEIAQRLQALQKEHNDLLQEAATIITINKRQ